MVNELSVSIYFSPISNAEFEAKARVIEAELEKIDDAYIQNFYLATIGWNELTRGRVARAHATADKMIALGKKTNDPRALGYGTAMKALIAMVADDHEKALAIAEEAHKASKVEFERAIAQCDRLLAGEADTPSPDRPTEAEVYYLKSKALFYLENLEGALFLVRRAIKTAGDVAVYRAFEGQILFELGQFDDARRQLEHAVLLEAVESK